MKKRIYYPKEFKKQAIIELSNGKRLEDIIRSGGFDIDDLIKKDKKYCAKLLYKWRKEFAQKANSRNTSSNNVTIGMVEYDIENLLYDDENDIIMSEMKDKIRCGAEKYKNLKKHIIDTYHRKKHYPKKI